MDVETAWRTPGRFLLRALGRYGEIRTGNGLSANVPLPNRPNEFVPQQYTAPSVVTPHV